MGEKKTLQTFFSRKDAYFILCVSFLLLIIIVAQQAIPSGALIPFARIDGEMIRIRSSNDITKSFEISKERTLTLTAENYSATYTNGDLGIALDAESTIRPYVVESRIKRLIPFSVVAHMYRNSQPTYTASEKSLFIVTSSIADEVDKDPVNAQVSFSGEIPKIISSETGLALQTETASQTILSAVAEGNDQAILTSKVIQPEVTTKELETAVDAYIRRLPERVTITIDSQKEVLPRNTLVSWLDYTVESGLPVISFSDELVMGYAEQLSANYASTSLPSPTIVTVVDGKEVGRIEGRPGKAVITEDLVTALNSVADKAVSDISVGLKDVPSPIRYSRSYTKSQRGLTKLLEEITSGKEISIYYEDINGRGWSTGSRQFERSRMASTYKLFVAYSVLKRIEEGSMSFAEQINGKTVDACLRTIIIDSNNECAIALAEKIGWTTIANEGKALGATGLDWSVELWGTAYDAAVIPLKLARGEILSPANQTYLLDLMKQQRFRSGIPAGTKYLVADKVGFLDGWLNDTGIVYAPEVPYVLAIFTKGQSWGTVAEITKQVENVTLL